MTAKTIAGSMAAPAAGERASQAQARGAAILAAIRARAEPMP